MLLNKLTNGQFYTHGTWLPSQSSQRSRVINPANASIIGEVACCGEQETEACIASAKEAFITWSSQSAEHRSRALKNFHNVVLERKNELAQILTQEQGKPLTEALLEINYGAAYLEWYAEEARRIYGDVIAANSPSQKVLVLKEPVGVVAAITPWNFPHAMIMRKMAPALAAGCTFICKPAPETPLSALAIAACAEEAGFAPGVINIITGDAEKIGGALMRSNLVRKVSFTGSTEVGKILIERSAPTVKKLTLELGGNAPYLVFADANLEKAVNDAIYAKYRNAGQTCICTNRFLVEENIEQEFTEKFIEATKKLKVGDGLTPGTDIGPLITKEACTKVARLCRDALDKGAKILLGAVPDEKSQFMQPTVLSHINSEMQLWQEEIFGPVATIRSFKTEEEALSLANSTVFGLASYVYTNDLSRAMRVSSALHFGMVGVNDAKISLVQAPFGGVKHSGFGREGGKYGMEEYLNLKYVLM